MVAGFIAGMAVGGTAGYLLGSSSNSGGSSTVNDNRTYNDNRSYDQSQHFYGDMRSVQDLTNIIISKAVVDVGMQNSSKCNASASVTQAVNAKIKRCSTSGDINMNFVQKAVIDFKCVVRNIQNNDQISKFVNDVKANLNQKIQSDTAIGSEQMTATVQKTMTKIVNETVTKAMIKNVFESITSVNQKQMINADLSDCTARNINIKATMQFEMRQIISSNTETSFKQQSQSFNELDQTLKQVNVRMEKGSTQAIIWGIVIAVVAIVALFIFYKWKQKQQPQQPSYAAQYDGPYLAEPQAMPYQPAQAVMKVNAQGPNSNIQMQDLSKVMPPRTHAYNQMFGMGIKSRQ